VREEFSMAVPNTLKMQLNTPVSFTRDMKVELTNQTTGEKRKVTPYLDGSVVVPNIDAGNWRVQVQHPNIHFDVFDRPIKVLPDRPTFVPITIPTNIFENVPIEDVPDANLGPAQQHLDEAMRAAEQQANKKAGQPIYADDWNELSTTVSTVAKATRELTDLVSPRGHDHPEIAAKFDEIQRTLQRLLDTFGASLAQLQRQIQQLALQRKVEAALDKTVNIAPETRRAFEEAVGGLQTAWADSPGVYGSQKRRVASDLQGQLAQVLANESAEVRASAEVKDLDEFTRALATERPAITYDEEIQQQQRSTSKSTTGVVFDAFKTRARG
jgi:hypothetical protein